MAKILLIISALVIAATAYLGFATKQKVEAVQGELSEKKKTLSIAQTDLTKTKGTLKKTEEELVGAKADIETKEKDIAAKKGEIDGLNAKIKTTDEALAAANAELDKLKKTPTGEVVDVDKIKAELDELRMVKTKLESQVAELTQSSETLTKQAADAKAQAANAENQVKSYKQNYTQLGVTGTVLAYNPGWNFVVLNIGDRQSLKAGKELVVKRGGQMIAKVKVTSVEPSTSIADIIPNTVVKGQSVQPGDSVVYEGRNIY